MMAKDSSRDKFFSTVRRALGREAGTPNVAPDESTFLAQDAHAVSARADAVRLDAENRADELTLQFERSAADAGCKVARVPSPEEAAAYIESLARDLEARSILRSDHTALGQIDIEAVAARLGIRIDTMAIAGPGEAGREEQRTRLRRQADDADIGLTGVDYAIAETGTCVLLPRKGVSRLVSLLPPVHVAIVTSGQVLPSLDELFTLQRDEHLKGRQWNYGTLITGPSRSADIEYTLVTGVHGPGEVHVLLMG